MTSFEIFVLAMMGIYVLGILAVGLHASRSRDNEGFVIGNRNVGYVPIIGSLASSFRDGSGIVIWIGFGFTIGYGGMWLMLGALGALTVYMFFGPRVRQQSLKNDYITVGELVRFSIGPITEKVSAGIVLLFSILIVSVQLYVSGNILAEIINLDYWIGVLSVAIIVGMYLVFGGYGSVVRTDVIQLIFILSLVAVPFIVSVPDAELFNFSSLQTLPLLDRVGLFLIGFFVVISGADVWQKLFSARDDSVIKIGFPVSGLVLIVMTLSLIWLGMASKGLLVGQVEDGGVLFETIDQQIFPAWFLACFVVVFIAITMSTLDTFCYLFASTLAKNFIPERMTEVRGDYIRFSKIVLPFVLIASSILALTISDIIQFIFSAASLILILAPLYTIVGFGWSKKSRRLDIWMSMAILVSASVYVVMFIQGYFEQMIMLTVPVLVNAGLSCYLILLVRSNRHHGYS